MLWAQCGARYMEELEQMKEEHGQPVVVLDTMMMAVLVTRCGSGIS